MTDDRSWPNLTPEERKQRVAAAQRARRMNSALRRITKAEQQIIDDTALVAELRQNTEDPA